ncbi:MAG: endonuclease domain-containing protein [Caulobacteraceae bacterium]|nr:endonuclease domain-containing protein [Caulobacteraceae bacterium]
MYGRRASTRRARELRKTLTPPEARLWLQLRGLRSEGFHFRRQAPFRGYYLDFVCFNHWLVMEVDGGGHNDQVQADHDAVRDRILKRQGFHTLRLSNGDINTNMAGVMEAIMAVLGSPAGP